MDKQYLIGYWDCPQCGATQIRGDEYDCPKCGKHRTKDTQFYLPDNITQAEVITDTEGIRAAQAGPDWICGHCGASNSALDKACSQCSAPPSAEPRRFADDEQEPAATEAPSLADKVRERFAFPFMPIVAIVLSIIAVATLGLAVFSGRPTQVTVKGYAWERTIAYEEYKTVRESDWSVPQSGRLVHSYTAIRTYIQVVDHYETRIRQVPYTTSATTAGTCTRNLGNGRFQTYSCPETSYSTQYRSETYSEPIYRSQPVYDTKYDYDIERWVYLATQKSKGTDHSPQWPLAPTNKNPVRESGRSEHYSVLFADTKGKIHEYQADLADWTVFDLGASYTARVNWFGVIVAIAGQEG